MITGVFSPRRGRLLAAHGNAMGSIRYKIRSHTRGAPFGASDLAEVLNSFLKNAEQLIHRVLIVNHPENSDE
jgi:hypothetical protein